VAAIFAIFWLVALIKILSIVRKPYYCAIWYIIPVGIYRFVTAETFLVAGISTAITFGYVTFYFWLLDRFSESILVYIFILVAGFVGPPFLLLYISSILYG